MNTDQIYSLLNGVAAEGLGGLGLPAITNPQTLMSFGNAILNSQSNTEAFLNTLIQRVGKTIFSYRKYTSKDAQDLTRDTMEFGAILQKIKVRMTKAQFDPSYDLDDPSVNRDPFKVDKPVVRQTLFVKRTPDMYTITVPVDLLNEAFLSDAAAGTFISTIYAEVRNSIEYGLNQLAKTAKIGAMSDTLKSYYGSTSNMRVIDPLTEAIEYGIIDDPFENESTPVWTDEKLNAIFTNESFLKYAIQRINGIVDMLGELTTNFSATGDAHFTPEKDLKVLLSSDFVRACETHVQAGAFNDEKVSLKAKFRAIPFWQTSRYGTPKTGELTDGTEITTWAAMSPIRMLNKNQIVQRFITTCIAFNPFALAERDDNDITPLASEYYGSAITGRSLRVDALTVGGEAYINGDAEVPYTEIAAVAPVIGFAFDRTALGIVEKPERDYSILNPKDQTWHNYYHVNNMYYCDPGENAVVFTLGKPTMYIKAHNSTRPANTFVVKAEDNELAELPQ